MIGRSREKETDIQREREIGGRDGRRNRQLVRGGEGGIMEEREIE